MDRRYSPIIVPLLTVIKSPLNGAWRRQAPRWRGLEIQGAGARPLFNATPKNRNDDRADRRFRHYNFRLRARGGGWAGGDVRVG